MKTEIGAHFYEMSSSGAEYIKQIQKVIQAMENAHLLFPRSEKVIGLLIHISLDNLDRRGVTYRNNKTGQTNYWPLPRDQKLWLQGRYDYYMKELLAVNPQAAALATPNNPGLLEQIRKIPTAGWIAIGVGLAIIVLAIIQGEAQR